MIDSSVPEVIGGYELVRPLGRGGMAEVWLARKGIGEKGSKYIAIKLIAEHFLGDERYARMFRAEAELAAVLNHANIVQVFDEGEEDGRSYIVMEWVDGLNLLKLGEKLTYVEEQRRFRLTAYIIGQLLHALHYAHCIRSAEGHPLGVVHRDVSPQNVLVSINGEVKLTDFGVAHHNFEESSGMHVKGKVRYMPPEQLSGRSRSPTVDLYAVGALLHELLDGKKFRGGFEDGQDLFTVVLTGHVPPLSRPAPPALDHLRLRLLERDPARRLQTAEEALALLERFAAHGDAREELRKLCGSATGVLHPRVSPGPSSPVAVADQATEPRRRHALAKPRVGPPAGRPPPLRLPRRPATGSMTAVKERGDPQATPNAWPSGLTELTPPQLPRAMTRDAGPSGLSATEPLAPPGDLALYPAHAPPRAHASSGTEQDILAPLVAGEGTVTQDDRRARTHRAASSPPRAASTKRSTVALLGLLPVVMAASMGLTWWSFARVHDDGPANEGTRPVSVESSLRWLAASSSPSATVIAAAEAVPDPRDDTVVLEPTPAADPNPASAAALAITMDARPVGPVKAPPRKAVVRVAASSGLKTAEVRLGRSKTLSVDAGAYKIVSGTHTLAWRKTPSEAWQPAGKWSFRPGKAWIIHINKKGLSIRLAE